MLLTRREDDAIKKINREIDELERLRDGWGVDRRPQNETEFEVFYNADGAIRVLAKERHEIMLAALKRRVDFKTCQQLRAEREAQRA